MESSTVHRLFLRSDNSIRDVIMLINNDSRGIALVVDDQQRLLLTVTDGDIRRAILAGIELDAPVSSLKDHKVSEHAQPITAAATTSHADLLALMQTHVIRQIPLLDEGGRVVDIVTIDDMLPRQAIPLQAVIMAGGLGLRLRPLTEDIPKPMLPIGGRPLLERIIARLRLAGIQRVKLTTYYRDEMIVDHFGDGRDYGVEIEYVREEQPLGTAGALSLLDPPQEPLLVINGDILTRVDFRAMLDFHRKHEAQMTVGVRQYEFRIPYGTIESDGLNVTGISEKPVIRHFINAGIYLLNPGVQRLIPNGQRYDMTSLIEQLVTDGQRVVSFPIHEYWLDIGQHEDYQRAQADVSHEED